MQDTTSTLKEKCKKCGDSIPIKDLRSHISKCGRDHEDTIVFEKLLDQPVFPSSAAVPTTNASTLQASTHASTQIISVENTPLLEQSVQFSKSTDLPTEPLATAHTDAHQAIDEEMNETNIDSRIMKVVREIEKKGIQQNPVECLRYLQNKLISDRALEIVDLTVENTGLTNFILVDRSNLLQTGLDELRSLEDIFLTLEVQFYDEVGF